MIHGPKVATTPDIVTDLYDLDERTIPAALREITPPGVLTMIEPEQMPPIPEEDLKRWIESGHARVGGTGNTSGPIARLGLSSVTIANLGAGTHTPHDPQGEFCKQSFDVHGITPAIRTESTLPTSTTFIVGHGQGERPGIVYAPNANVAIDLKWVTEQLRVHRPDVVHFMYLGLSGERVDREIRQYLRCWREELGIIVSADTHTLTPDPRHNAGRINPHKLLPEVFPELNLFFCSLDEAKLIWKALGQDPAQIPADKDTDHEHRFIPMFLDHIFERFNRSIEHRQLFGVTQKDRVWFKEANQPTEFVDNLFLASADGRILVGAGDGFRAGVLSRIACEPKEFLSRRLKARDALGAGNLVAALAISGPADERTRFNNLPKGGWDSIVRVVRSGADFNGRPLSELLSAIKSA